MAFALSLIRSFTLVHMSPVLDMTLDELFEQFDNLRVLIIGDVMLDSYVWGRVERISPEAPVPVVTVDRRELR